MMGQRDSRRREAEGGKALVVLDSGPAAGTVAQMAGREVVWKWEKGNCFPQQGAWQGGGEAGRRNRPHEPHVDRWFLGVIDLALMREQLE